MTFLIVLCAFVALAGIMCTLAARELARTAARDALDVVSRRQCSGCGKFVRPGATQCLDCGSDTLPIRGVA